MSKVALFKDFESFLSSIKPKSFLTLCTGLLQHLHPDDKVKFNSNHSDQYCIIDGSFYIHQHFSQNYNIDVKSILKTHLAVHSKLLKSSTKLIYLTNTSKFEITDSIIKSLRNKSPKLKIETWSPAKLKSKLVTLNEAELKELLGEYSLYAAYQSSYTVPETERDILKDIFSYLFANKITEDIEFKPSDKKATKIREKIKINFSSIQHPQVSASFKHHLKKILLVEKFIQDQMEQNEDSVFELVERIQNEYCRINKIGNAHQPIKDHQVFEKLTKYLLESSSVPEDKIHNASYNACGKAIVLYFFEICDIGRRTEEEEKDALEKAKDDPFLPFPEE